MIIKNLLPYGVVNYLSPYFDLRLLGLSKWKALQLALLPQTAFHLRFTRLNLLPRNSFDSLEYIVDVGANRGIWSLGILSLLEPKKLIAIEPSPVVQSFLKSSLEGYPCVEILPIAVGKEEGTMELNITVHSSNTSILKPRNAQMNQLCGNNSWNVVEKVEVNVNSLDNLLADLPEISLLKIDVQGYEKFVLKGAEEILKKTKFVMLEVGFISHYEGDTLFAELNQRMSELGFSLVNLKVCNPQNSQKITWGDGIYAANNLIEQ